MFPIEQGLGCKKTGQVKVTQPFRTELGKFVDSFLKKKKNSVVELILSKVCSPKQFHIPMGLKYKSQNVNVNTPNISDHLQVSMGLKD